ncbi:HlyD family secretion protein [Flavobacterium sp. LBUM151]
MEKKKTNTKFIIILTVLVLVGGTYGITKYMHSLAHEETDDAQIEKKMNPIIPRVSGYISKVYVKDNDFVKKGDTLFTIDKRDYQLKIDEANAALLGAEGQYEAAKADIGSAYASISVSDAQMRSAGGSIESAKIRLRQLTNDFNRYNNLYKTHTITKQQFEQAQTAKDEAENQVRVLEQQQRASSYQKSVIQSKSKVSDKQTDVLQSSLELADCLEVNKTYSALLSGFCSINSIGLSARITIVCVPIGETLKCIFADVSSKPRPS